MRHPVRSSLWVLVAATLAACLASARPAAAQCDFACQRVGPGFCQQCLYTPGANADCADDGVCHCWDVQCYAFTAEQALRRELGLLRQAPEVNLCAAEPDPRELARALFAPARS
jgi:hypothetical protein